jgi:hypothetical protein
MEINEYRVTIQKTRYYDKLSFTTTASSEEVAREHVKHFAYIPSNSDAVKVKFIKNIYKTEE